MIQSSFFRYSLFANILVAAVLVFQGLTLRPGHNWDGDYALNVMQAINLAEGTPYEKTHYLANAENAIHPALYPPGLALMLVPIYKIFGVDLDTMKWVGLIAFAAWLIVFASIARQFIHPVYALVCVALMGMHPYFWELKDTIYAEFPFLLFCYCALACSERAITLQKFRERFLATAGIAVGVALAYATRTVAVVLFPVIAAISSYHLRTLLNLPMAGLAVAAGLIALISHWLPTDAATYVGYFEQFNFRSFILGGLDYALAIGDLIQISVFQDGTHKMVLLVAFLALAVVGFIAKIRESVSVYEIFVIAYAALLLVYPIRFEAARYSLPLWPLILLYAFRGVISFGHLFSSSAWTRYAPTGLAALLVGTFGFAYAKKDFRPIENSATDSIANDLYAAIRQIVPVDGVILARKPTIIGLFTERTSTTWPRSFGDDTEFWRYAHAVNAGYLIQDVNHFGDGEYDPNDRLDRFVETNRSNLALAFENEWFRVYVLPPEQASG